MTDLVPVGNPDDIANLPAEQRDQMITHALVESKQWLAVATKGTDPTPIAQFKAWAATLAEATKQKGLAQDIQMDALEMVRRAERGIGVAIRNGQEAGEIRKRGERDYHNAEGDVITNCKVSPYDYAPPGELKGNGVGIYALTDDVTDDEFEEALDGAREEKDLTRANVARKAREQREGKPPPSGKPTLSEKIAQVRQLAEANSSSRQIAETIGMRVNSLRKFAARHDIPIPADAVMGDRYRRIDPARVVAETVSALEGLAMGVQLVAKDDYLSLDPDLVKEWSTSLTRSLAAINRMRKEMNRVGK